MGTEGKQRIHDLAVTTLRVEQHKLDALARIAEAEHRTVSQQMRVLIDRALAEAEGSDPEPTGAAA